MATKSLLNYYLAIQHYTCTEITYKNTIGSTLKMNESNILTTREHGLGELQDQVWVGHIIEAWVVAEER